MKTTSLPFSSLLRPTAIAALRGKTFSREPEKLKAVAQQFEALMMEQMVREMRRAVPKSTLMGREMDQELFGEILDGEFVRLMVQRGGLGLADFMVKSLSANEK